MSNYRRFITYLFKYESGEKQQQVGYAKIEQRQNVGRIELHIKDCRKDLVEVRPYFFARETRIPIGTMPVKNGAADGLFRFECSKMGDTEYDFQDMRGLIIPLGMQEVLFSQWDDEVYSWQDLMEKASSEMVKTEVKEKPTITREMTLKEANAPMMEAAEASNANLMQQIQALRPRIYPFKEDHKTWAIQAQLRDMKFLPKEYWHLSNNSFVLRGYFNYGSILIGCMEEEQRWFIGIPGVFYKQEKVIAGMFGFSEFRSKRGRGEQPGEFGYWYQLLNMVR